MKHIVIARIVSGKGLSGRVAWVSDDPAITNKRDINAASKHISDKWNETVTVESVDVVLADDYPCYI